MARGYTDIYLIGGSRDSEILEHIPLRNLPNSISIRGKSFFAYGKEGMIAIKKGEIDNTWHSYHSEIYVKKPNRKHMPGTIFEFKEEVMIERCKAQTKKGFQCLHASVTDDGFCNTHKTKPASNK